MVAQELIHSMGRKNRRTIFFALKVDMSKAYDRVEWPFLLWALHLFGFPQNFIDLIKACVYTFRIRVNINGEVDKFFCPKRGIWQGCPLSYYMFTICSEVLSTLPCERESYIVFKDIKISYSPPSISHLIFPTILWYLGRSISVTWRLLDIFLIFTLVSRGKW